MRSKGKEKAKENEEKQGSLDDIQGHVTSIYEVTCRIPVIPVEFLWIPVE